MRVLTTLLFLAALAASTRVAFQWQAVREARSEAVTLSEQNAAKETPAQEETNAAEELQRLRTQTSDLLKLRNQVGQLRAQMPALAKARAENTRLLEAQQTAGNPKAEANLPRD